MKKLFLLLLLLMPLTALADIEYRVDTNYGRETRPMKSIETNKTIGRIAVGSKCAELSYATFFGRYQYHIVINELGVTGAAVCVAIEIENPYLQQVPGRIEFENYTAANDSTPESNRGELHRDDFGVDIENKTGTPDGFNVGWTRAGEWLEYEVIVNDTALYQVTARYARVAQANPHVNLSFSVDGVQVYVSSGTITATGAWDVWEIEDAGLIFLPAGRYTLRLNIDNGPINLDWFEIIPVDFITIEVMGIS